MNLTQAYQTVGAVLTLTSAATYSHPIPNTPAQLEEVLTTPAVTKIVFTSTARLETPARTPTPEELCDRAAPGLPGIDVTIDDDTVMQPGERFTKIWRLANTGTCTWRRDYQAVWFFGTRFGDTLEVNLGENVRPGESIDIIVDMVAPMTAGSHRSNWKLRNENGEMFGIGPSGSSPFWVQIVVVMPPTATPSATVTPTFTPTETPPPTITPTPTVTPVVFARGEVVLETGDSLDMEEIQVNPSSGADLLYRSDENRNYWLVPQSPFLLGIFGNSEPGKGVCQTATMSSAPVAVGSLNPGVYLCFLSNEGRPGWLRLTSVNTTNFAIHLEVLTWDIP